jgi:hypothetical protein
MLEEPMMKPLPLMAPAVSAALFLCQSGLADTVHARFPRQARDLCNVYSRMFPDLPPFAPQTDQVRNAVSLIGAKGGLLDPMDDLSDPVQSFVDPQRSLRNPDNPSMTAGMTFFGQLLDHDITLDLRSRLLDRAQPERTVNFRSSAFDLDMVYGDGPERSLELRVQSAGDIKFIVEPLPGSDKVSRPGALRYDLPRDAAGTAIIGDSRNDEDVILSQLHLATLRFHNAVTDHLRALPEHRRRIAQGRLLAGAAPGAVALSMGHRQRIPAADDRAGSGRRAAARRDEVLCRRGRTGPGHRAAWAGQVTRCPQAAIAVPGVARSHGSGSSSRPPHTASAIRRCGRATG